MADTHTIETPLIRDIINQQNAHRTPIVSRGDGPESLLPRRVPYLQLHSLAVEFDGADLEIYAYGGDERGSEAVFTEAEETA